MWWMVNSTPRPLYPPGKTRYPLYRRLDGPQGRSGQVRKMSPPTGIRSPDRPARSESLYQLSYSGQREIAGIYFKVCNILILVLVCIVSPASFTMHMQVFCYPYLNHVCRCLSTEVWSCVLTSLPHCLEKFVSVCLSQLSPRVSFLGSAVYVKM
jgi:hypothetical protein